MSSLHQEKHFEAEICQHLGQQGWLYEEGAAETLDSTSGLFMADLLAFPAGGCDPQTTGPAVALSLR